MSNQKNYMKNFIIVNYLQWLQSVVPIETVKVFKNEIILVIVPEFLVFIVKFLKLNTQTQYKILTCISGTDYPQYSKRFEVSYEFLSLTYNKRLRLKSYVSELDCISTITQIFPCANWWEREIWDLFGVFFTNNLDLRRILTDYGFDGHPLKKCFPLTGYFEVKYQESVRRVICQPIKQLPQEFRNFNFSNPWS